MKKTKKIILVLAIVCTGIMAHLVYAGGQGDYCDEYTPCNAGFSCVNNVCIPSGLETGEWRPYYGGGAKPIHCKCTKDPWCDECIMGDITTDLSKCDD